MTELQMLAAEVRNLVKTVNPYLTRREMAERKKCCTKTLSQRVVSGDYPKPTKNGLWLREEVMQWEALEISQKSPK